MICRRTEIVLKEGWRYLGFAFFASFVLYLFGLSFFSFLFFLLFLFFIIIFRNPERVPYEFDEYSLLSPIDGKVTFIGKEFESRFLKKEMLLVRIKSSIFDVGILRNPTDLKIVKSRLIYGLSLQSAQKAKTLNQRVEIFGKCDGKELVILSLLQGCLDLSIFCENFKKLRKGDRYLFMSRGEVYLYLPLECRLKIAQGERVVSGESVLGYFVNEKQ